MAIEITAFCENCHQRGAVVVSARDARPLCPSCGRFLLEIREISGFIYIISNSAMPGLLIGQTTRGVDERAAELNAATGVPALFVIEAWFESTDPQSDENQLHRHLTDSRLEGRKFFRTSLENALQTAQRVLGRSPCGKLKGPGRDTCNACQKVIPPPGDYCSWVSCPSGFNGRSLGRRK
jgi:hypothetical protein